MNVLSAHVAVCAGTPTGTVLASAQTVLAERFGLTHATLQVEEGNDPRCQELSW
jgi:cobalt-zinc-cadmium efflux system protein